jgi:uncharacterized membrane protein (DUF485 family)
LVEKTSPAQHAAYERIHASEDFRQLRKRYLGFAVPMTVAFMVWYLLYVVASNWAGGLMDTQLLGNINVALVFGLLQFVSTFLIAWLYARHANRELDPIAERLRQEYEGSTR